MMQSVIGEAARERLDGAWLPEPEPRADLKPVVALCSSKGTEVVEIEGFHAVRKRKRTEAPPRPAAPAPEAADAQPAPGQGGTAGAAIPGPQQQGAVAIDAKLHEDAAAQTPPLVAPPAESLLPPPLQQQQQDSATQQGADAAVPMDIQVPCADEQQQPQLEEAAAEEVPPLPQPTPEKDLTAVVGDLLAFVPDGCPTAVSVAWLLRETLRAGVAPGDADGAAAATAVLEAFQQELDQKVAAAQQLLLQGDPEQLRQFDKLPPMLRSMCSSERHMANLRQQLAALEQEEAAWLALEVKYQPGAACPLGGGGAGSGDSAAAAGDAAEEAAVEAQEHVDVGMLEDAQRRAERQLSLQVDAINSMLEKAELVVIKAQEQCASLQAEFHKENFQSYAHVNSPQVIVKMLSQVPPVAGVDFVPSSPPTQS